MTKEHPISGMTEYEYKGVETVSEVNKYFECCRTAVMSQGTPRGSRPVSMPCVGDRILRVCMCASYRPQGSSRCLR
jgi:hypothetical protein